jgi:hypothetical protein
MRIRNAEGRALPLKPGAKPFLVGKLFLRSVFHSAGHAETSRGIAMFGRFPFLTRRWPISTFVCFMAQNLRQEERAVEKQCLSRKMLVLSRRGIIFWPIPRKAPARAVCTWIRLLLCRKPITKGSTGEKDLKERRAESIEQ